MDEWPALSYDEWRDTRDTLHMYTQIVGKIRLALSPFEPQWANVPLYVTARGLTTSPVPSGLRAFDIDGATSGDGTDALVTGRVARVTIQAPLPYQLHCTVRVDEATPHQRLVTTVDGDLQGPARLELRAVDGGTEARLAWSFELRAPLLRTLALLGRPAMAWAHDRIVERGLVQFEGHALRERDRLR